MSSSSSVLRLDEARTTAGEWSLAPSAAVVGMIDAEEQREEEEGVSTSAANRPERSLKGRTKSLAGDSCPTADLSLSVLAARRMESRRRG